jgi:hypothetical protein
MIRLKDTVACVAKNCRSLIMALEVVVLHGKLTTVIQFQGVAQITREISGPFVLNATGTKEQLADQDITEKVG